MKAKYLKLKTGFSLIEALIAIAILIVGILSAFLLLIRTTATIPAMQARLTAANLAQEGIEEVRALRDSDFVSGKDFKEFLGANRNATATYQIEVAGNMLGKIYLLQDLNDKPLYFEPSLNLYSYYSSGPGSQKSIFYRSITINATASNYIDVTAEVKYNLKGKDQIITATDRLYNWLNPTP